MRVINIIRLLALKQLMRNVSATEATQLACGNTAYIRMFNTLPYILPRTDWKELIHAQLLCNIKGSDINARYIENAETPLNRTKIMRIRNYPLMPEAEYIKEPTKILSNEIVLAQQFYTKILKPMQLPIYNLDEDPYLKWYQLQTISRSSMLGVVYILSAEMKPLISQLQSTRTASKGYILNTYGADARMCRLVNSAQSNAHNLYYKNDDDIVESIQTFIPQIDKMYDFIYRIRVVGILNDALMNAEYELPFIK